MYLGYTGLHGELEHLKIETRLINEMFEHCSTNKSLLLNRKNEIYRQDLYMSIINRERES
jgi:hypothetical protein